MKEFLYKLSKFLARPVYLVTEGWWSLKFRTLCKYYGGGGNIPPEVLMRWCPIGADSSFDACMGASEHIVAMNRFIGIPVQSDIAMLYFGAFMHGNAATHHSFVMGRRIAYAIYPAQQYFRCQYIHGDYQRKIKFLLSQPDKLKEFRDILKRQNEHLTLAISV